MAAALGAALLDLVVVWWSARVSAGRQPAARAARRPRAPAGAGLARQAGQASSSSASTATSSDVIFAGMAVQMVGNAVLIAGMLVMGTTIQAVTALVLGNPGVQNGGDDPPTAGLVGARGQREGNAQLYGDLEERLGGLEDLRANGAGPYAVHRLHHPAPARGSPPEHIAAGRRACAAAAIVFAMGTAGTLVAGIVLQQQGVISVGAVLTLYHHADMRRKPLEQIAEQLKEFQKGHGRCPPGVDAAGRRPGDRRRARRRLSVPARRSPSTRPGHLCL